MKVRQIKEAGFTKWKYQALTMRDKCAEGKITVEEYIQWMEDYFPDRKPKQDKKFLLIELKRSNRRDFLLREINGKVTEIVSEKCHSGFKIRKVVALQRLFDFWCHGANHFSLISLAERGNAYDDKTQILLIDLLDFTRFLASVRKKIDLKGRTLQGLSRKI